jgi:choline-phosphate cytidylyltransferase
MSTIRVYVDGVFDLFHYGHVRIFQQVREHFSKKYPDKQIYIIAGVVLDEDVMKYKRKPIMSYEERKEVVSACKYVDETIEAVLVLSNEFIDHYHIDEVVHGDDSEQYDFYKVAIERKIMTYLKYTKTISTTDIISRLKK